MPAAATMLLACAGFLVPRVRAWAGSVVGALGVQVVLRWPSHFFFGLPSAVATALVVAVRGVGMATIIAAGPVGGRRWWSGAWPG